MRHALTTRLTTRLLLTTLWCTLTLSCTHNTRTEISHAVVACAAQDASVTEAIVAEVAKLQRIVDGGAADRWTLVVTTAVADGLTVGGCAFARIVADRTTAPSSTVAARSADADTATIAFESYRAKYAGGATFALER